MPTNILYAEACLSGSVYTPHKLIFTLLDDASCLRDERIVNERPDYRRIEHVQSFTLQNTNDTPEDATYYDRVPLCLVIHSTRPILVHSSIVECFATVSYPPTPADTAGPSQISEVKSQKHSGTRKKKNQTKGTWIPFC